MSIQCTNLSEDRALGAYWEKQFVWLAATQTGRIATPHQIGRIDSATAIALSNGLWRLPTLPDVTIWSAPIEHHEIKHKEPNRYGGIGLEDYRLRALHWFAKETQQRVYYTLHLHNLSGGRNGKINNPDHWVTIDINRLVFLTVNGGARHTNRMMTWCNGEKKELSGWYWPVTEFKPLLSIWKSGGTSL